MIRLAIALMLFATAVQADPVQDLLDGAKADCAAMEGGVFVAGPKAVVPVDLTGDGAPETVVDSADFQCSTMASYWGGSLGNSMWVVVGGQAQMMLAQGWQVETLQTRPVLILWHSGAACGGAGIEPCVEAMIWSDQSAKFMTVAAPVE